MKNFSVLVLVLASVLGAGAGCSSDPKSPKIRTFVASDTSVPEGGSDVTFTWDVTNATSLELLPFPGVVTGSSATVTVTESTTFTLVARNKSRKAQRSVDIAVGATFDVTGRVVGQIEGIVLPVKGATVAIGDRVTITDADGRFAFTDVVPPYDLVVISEATLSFGGYSYVQVFHDVTRPDPTVSADGNFASPSPERNAQFTGTISGGVFPPVNGQVLMHIALEDGFQTFANLGAAAFDYSLDWNSAEPSVNLAANVVQYDFATYEYNHARVAGTLVDGGTLNLNPALVDVPEVDFTIEVTNDWGGNSFGEGSFGFAELGTYGYPYFYLPGVESTPGVFTIAPPVIANRTLTALAAAFDGDGYSNIVQRDPAGTSLVANLPLPTRALSPGDGATVGPLTPFTIVRPANQISVFSFEPNTLFGGPSFSAFVEVYTDQTTVEFPDLAAIGLPLPEGASFDWQVYSYGPWASLDEALGSPAGHWSPPGDVYTESGLMNERTMFTAASSGDDDDDDDVITIK